MDKHYTQPKAQGLYDPQYEHENCGIGLIVDMKGRKSHDIVKGALEICVNLDHRGGCGCDPITGDGAGIFIQLPHNFFKKVCPAECDFEVPEAGDYGVGFAFLSKNEDERKCEEDIITKIVAEESLELLGWRDVPVRSEILGKASSECEPLMRQFFIKRSEQVQRGLEFERKLYLVRRIATHRIRYSGEDEDSLFYISSLSSRTMTYKGMLTTEQLEPYFPDLSDPDMDSALALTHSRFSTNTFPSWPRAQPFRYLCHNGEINTVRGNENWLHARQMEIASEVFGDDLRKLLPIIREDGSDSQKFDNCLEFLILSGRSLAHAMMMMIPEPWERHKSMPQWKRDFYEFHACLMEPWDGPASMAMSDGVQVGATLDRNGLRPSRYYVTSDDRVILASEVGVLEGIEPKNVVKKGRLEPGRMFLIDMEKGCIIGDEELKQQIASEQPYGEWLKENLIDAKTLPLAVETPLDDFETIHTRQQAFGYTFEDMRFLIGPSAESGKQPLGSMGNDAPLAVLSDKPQLLYNYFKQLFAQVTNPPIDPIREELVTASVTFIGSEGDLTRPGPKSCRMIKFDSPLLDRYQLAQLRYLDQEGFKSSRISITFEAESGGLSEGHHSISEPRISGKGLEAALEQLFENADAAIRDGVNVLILSDRKVGPKKAPIPALLAVAGLHHHLVRQGTRTRVSLVLESGEPREVMHFALLLGYGADAINPYLALESVRHMVAEKEMEIDGDKACENFLKANLAGVTKTMSKMGISTIASYRGAQIFEAIGINQSVVDKYFTKTATRIEGIGMGTIAKETQARHTKAYAPRDDERGDASLDPGGVYQWRAGGERHLFNPITIHKLQKATRLGDFAVFKEYSDAINNQSKEMFTLRGLMEFKIDESKAIPIEEVEPVEAIVKRFKTGAMSYGSISKEAHESLAIAMNRLGGKSNTGEGGEDFDRFTPDANGDSRRSAIKQVASGRFGVNSFYLVNADELQIKIVQGAKPGEGGELPGHKVLPQIAKTRGTTPGVGLISPPPHHDIYSIEDLAELIHDLKNANIHARINTKLVSAVGVGTIAAGVAKAKSDVILVSGYDGGTGASPRSSIQHAGAPWELGLAETNQTLLLNDMRSRVVVETDGQLKTGRDVAIACLLGAEEFGFATAPLVTLGCLMMRVCHKNTCPVGVATQNPELRKKFMGGADAVVHFMNYVAEELRELMAKLGFRTINEMVGRVDKLEMRQGIDHWKARKLDYSKMLYRPEVGPEVGTYCQMKQDHLIDNSLDMTKLLDLAQPAIKEGKPVEINLPIVNTNRVVGTITGSEISRQHGPDGLPEDTVKINLTGSAGQSLGAFCPSGMTFTVTGDTNDYLGKGLSGAKIIVRPPEDSPFVAHENIITGNVCFYGATKGEAYIAGMAGERFCVRNSGVEAVIEGVGDHALEYMTGGMVINLGSTGRNLGAGMSGGVAYIYDEQGDFVEKRLNPDMVNVYQLIECGDEEMDKVRAKIEQHVMLTGSARGRDILADWPAVAGKFLKIMPQDYERVLQAQTRAEERGLQGEEAILAAFEENVKAGH